MGGRDVFSRRGKVSTLSKINRRSVFAIRGVELFTSQFQVYLTKFDSPGTSSLVSRNQGIGIIKHNFTYEVA